MGVEGQGSMEYGPLGSFAAYGSADPEARTRQAREGATVTWKGVVGPLPFPVAVTFQSRPAVPPRASERPPGIARPSRMGYS
jgi:hypothetical protein